MESSGHNTGNSILYAVGDVVVNRERPEAIFTHVAPITSRGDILFGNCETPYSDRGTPAIHKSVALRSSPQNISGLKYAGFKIMQLANNHHLDWGYEAFQDTVQLLSANGIEVVGAGNNTEEAHSPKVLQVNGTRIAFLAYACATVRGYEARPDKPGAAVVKIHTSYEQYEDGQPGTRPDIFTWADRTSLEAMRQDIGRARRQADIVVVGFHWGIHFSPVELADYEFEVGHAAIDAGANIVFGGHQHVLKAIEVYDGKAIFHGLGHFAMDIYIDRPSTAATGIFSRYGEWATGTRPGYPTYPYHPHFRRGITAKCVIKGKRIERLTLLPFIINAEGQPVPLTQAQKEQFDEVVGYQRWVTEEAGLDTRFSVEGDEVLVALGS